MIFKIWLLTSMGLLSTLGMVKDVSSTQTPMPHGIGVRLTVEGPVFVDSKGMTLYHPVYGLNPYSSIEACTDQSDALLLQQRTLEGRVDFPVSAPDLDTRRSCLQKRPPLLASVNASPKGKWSIYVHEDGFRQWAYDGKPLHRSIKDKTPGEINGAYPRSPLGPPWKLALAPLVGAPPGITARKTSLGLALGTTAGQTLYYSEQGVSDADRTLWRMLTAPVLAKDDKLPDWSVMTRRDGSRQWAYKGRPLFLYARDSGPDTAPNRILGDVFGGTYGQPLKGWRVALLKEAPAHPAEVTIQTLVDYDLSGMRTTSTIRVYADAKGMTLYTIGCIEDTADRLDCDDVGDSPRYWLSFCGGEKRCAKTWRPFAAPEGAHSIDNTWSVAIINPSHPWKNVNKSTQGLRVWAYRGRPVFTYAHDLRPGDFNGAPPEPEVDTGALCARFIWAYETHYRDEEV